MNERETTPKWANYDASILLDFIKENTVFDHVAIGEAIAYAQAALASQAQQPEYTFDQLTKMMMQAATKEGHKVTMKIKWALPPAPDGGEK